MEGEGGEELALLFSAAAKGRLARLARISAGGESGAREQQFL